MSNNLQADTNQNQPLNVSAGNKIPYISNADKSRFERYRYYRMLFEGDHFEAFKLQIHDTDFNLAYSKLRYIAVNLAGLLSKICADMLFSEPITIKVPGGDQKFVDALLDENKFSIQLYESALQNSYFGDELFKIRTGTRGKSSEMSVIIEEQTPLVYIPTIDEFNVRADPKQHVFAWRFTKDGRDYLRKEIHEIGSIKNEVWLLEGEYLVSQEDISILGNSDIFDYLETNVDVPLVYHTPNWKTGSRWNGFSDYHDVTSLLFAINNRISKIDNVLDLHTDPILIVPPGILDENGKPKKKYNKMIQQDEGSEAKPEYIVWDASLENAYAQLEKLIDYFYLVSEVSPGLLGFGDGIAESGRALKFKLLRTIGKVSRKKLYYDRTIKDVLYAAQVVAKEQGLSANGVKMTGKPVRPEIIWQDGLPIDDSELIETEGKALDIGITTVEDSIVRVYKVDEETAKKQAKKISDEKSLAVPNMGFNSKDNNINQ